MKKTIDENLELLCEKAFEAGFSTGLVDGKADAKRLFVIWVTEIISDAVRA